MHEFVVMINEQIITFRDFGDIPQEIDHVIKFAPHMPEPPHTQEQHDEMSQWNEKLQELMQRERNVSDPESE